MTNRLGLFLIASALGGLIGSTPASGQTLSRAAEQPKPGSIAPAGNAQSSGLLTQADVTGGSTSPQLALQAGDFFITGTPKTGFAKIYFRTTVPLTPDSAANTNASGASSSSGSGAASASTNTLSSAATVALLDPYGGILNLSGGYWRQIAKAYGRTADGHKTAEPLDNEGLFLDSRFGFKMVNLPDQTAESAKVGSTSVTPFATASVALRYAHSVYTDDYKKTEGLFEMSLAVVTNYAADTDVSSAFKNNLLAKRTWAVSLSIAFQMNGSLAITITGSPASGNGSAAGFGKNYQIGLKLLNSK